jgi:hypothetical protein
VRYSTCSLSRPTANLLRNASYSLKTMSIRKD